MKRILTLLICLILLSGMAAAQIETTANVRLRTGPSTDDRIITTLPKGTVLIDLDSIMYDAQERPWYWVAWEGQDGWVCGDYLKITGESEYGAPSGDVISESRWVSVSLLSPNGAEAYPSGFGGCELWLFPDGTAHWLVYNGDGFLSRNPVGHWTRTGDDSLVFYQAEDLETAGEEEMRSFMLTDEGLFTPWDDDLILCLSAYDVLDRWLPISRDRLLGEWTFYAGETEGWEYTAAEEGINSTIRFSEAPNGNISFDYRWNDIVKSGIAEYNTNGLPGENDLMTAWAPWYICIERQGDERIDAYLLDDSFLRVEKFYDLDGSPAVSTQDYVRLD